MSIIRPNLRAEDVQLTRFLNCKKTRLTCNSLHVTQSNFGPWYKTHNVWMTIVADRY